MFYSLQHTEIAESAKELRALKPKRIKENRNILANIEDSNWDSEFTCHLCSDKIPNVQLAFEHMIQKHSANNSKKPKLFANDKDTGKSLSEALIFASTNPQYDDRLFIELQVQDMKIPRGEHVVYRNCF